DLAVDHFAEGFNVVVHLEGAVDISLVALGRGNERGVWRQVVAAGVAGQAVDRRAGHPRGVFRALPVGVEHGHRGAVDQEARALGRPAVPAATGLVGVDAGFGEVALV